MDVDRGYYPRHAFIDRHFNPRQAARVFASLNHLLGGEGTFDSLSAETGRLTFVTSAGTRHLLTGPPEQVDAARSELAAAHNGSVVHDLVSPEPAAAGAAGDGPSSDQAIQVLLIESGGQSG